MKFKIKKGKHKHSNFFARLNFFAIKKKVEYTVKFGVKCWYDEGLVKQAGYNKLFGIGYYNHHDTSARIVWMPDYEKKGFIKLYSYIYNNRLTPMQDKAKRLQYITSVLVGTDFKAGIRVTGKGYEIRVSEILKQVDVEYPKGGWKLWPYFGGKDKAYHEMTITLNK